MGTHSLKIVRYDDKKIVVILRKIAQQAKATADIQLDSEANFSITDLNNELPDELNQVIEQNKYHIEYLRLTVIPGLTVSFRRDLSTHLDSLTTEYNNSSATVGNEFKIQTNKIIHEEFIIVGTTLGTETNLPDQFIAAYQSTLDRLQHLNQNIAQELFEHRLKLEREFNEKLQNQAKNLNAEFELKNEQLEELSESLRNKKKEIDDRGNTHARRALRDKILSDVTAWVQSFGVSDSTAKKRRPVFIGMMAMLALFVLMIGFSAYELHNIIPSSSGLANTSAVSANSTMPSQSQIYWFLWARLSLSFIGALATLLYYIRWENRWAEQHSINEFQIRQFNIDINRANWVLESCIEWKKETNDVIPSTLLSSITNNLFTNTAKEPEKVIHPADELASALLGTASKLKLKVGDSELELNPQKIPKEVPGAAEKK